jgi:hypothetical protein
MVELRRRAIIRWSVRISVRRKQRSCGKRVRVVYDGEEGNLLGPAIVKKDEVVLSKILDGFAQRVRHHYVDVHQPGRDPQSGVCALALRAVLGLWAGGWADQKRDSDRCAKLARLSAMKHSRTRVTILMSAKVAKL